MKVVPSLASSFFTTITIIVIITTKPFPKHCTTMSVDNKPLLCETII